MKNKEHFESQCTTCTQRWGSQCSSAHLQYVYTLDNCPLKKWNKEKFDLNKKPVVWITQDFAQGGITSFIDYAVPVLAESNTPVLAVLHQSDFKYDKYRADRVSKYCPIYRFGEEPADLLSKAKIVTFSYFYSEDIFTYLIPRLKNKVYDTLIFQAHGDCIHTRQSVKNQKKLSDHMLFNSVWGMAPTEFSRTTIQEETGLSQEFVHPMYYGVEQEKYHVKAPRLILPEGHRFYSPEPYRFLCVGRLDPHKQFDYSAELVKEFKERGSRYKPFADATLTVIGDGWAKDEVLKSLAPYSFVKHIPWLDTDELINAMRQHDMLLMHSRSEGGPIVTLEALSCGIPVHSTPVGLHAHLNSLDPTYAAFATTKQSPSLYPFVKHTNFPQSIHNRYEVVKRVKQLHSKVSLTLEQNAKIVN